MRKPHPIPRMARIQSFLLLVLLACAPLTDLQGQTGETGPDHALWDGLLRNYVRADGLVDYRGLTAQRGQLEAYLAGLGSQVPDSTWGSSRRLAYFINLYNALTVRLILDHYPLGSIRDLPDPWGQVLITLGGQAYSLDAIEHQVLRKMGEPRIHFALNCASLSCPALQPRAFTEKELNAQLDAAARAFINDTARNQITPRTARLSRIFQWYRSDFGNSRDKLTAFLDTYLDTPLEPGCRIGFLPYDWNLNEVPPE